MDFSIIIPAKNESENIGKCIESIKNHCDYPGNLYEIIVVDNGSTDDTVHIAESLGARVFVKPDVTISFLRNFGASVASGKILVFLDADCTVKKGWLQYASVYLGREDVVCFGAAPLIPDHSTWVQTTWFMARGRGEDVKQVHWLESTNMFVRSHVFVRLKGFDETLITCEDVDISYRLLQHGNIVSDPKIQIIHHREPASVSEFLKKEKWRGKSNYSGLLKHGLKLSEIPSLIIPLYYGFFTIMFLLSIFFGNIILTLACLIFGQAPLVLITSLKLKGKHAGLIQSVRLYVLYNVYFSARFLSIFK